MNAYTKSLITTGISEHPEKYHHASAKMLKTLADDPCWWSTEGTSFEMVENSFCKNYTFNEVHIYYAIPNEVKKAFNISKLNNKYIMPDGIFFFIKKENITNGDIDKEYTINKLLAKNC